jgi:hypothetical protein
MPKIREFDSSSSSYSSEPNTFDGLTATTSASGGFHLASPCHKRNLSLYYLDIMDERLRYSRCVEPGKSLDNDQEQYRCPPIIRHKGIRRYLIVFAGIRAYKRVRCVVADSPEIWASFWIVKQTTEAVLMGVGQMPAAWAAGPEDGIDILRRRHRIAQ